MATRGCVRDRTRGRLLDAAARVFARHGAAGATTRRIATEAGVNEVTLFRLFGTKEALLHAAVHATALAERPTALPERPADPPRELATWCAAELARLRRSGELLRQCFAESEVQPGHVREAEQAVDGCAAELRRYAARLDAVAVDAADREAAVTMLVSTIVTDALARAELPGVHPTPAEEVPPRYARAFLRALGWGGRAAAGWAWSPPDEADAHA